MESNIRKYQQDIIDAIENRLEKKETEIVIQMATGTGRSTVIKLLLERLDSSKKVLIITPNNIQKYQWKEIVQDKKNTEIYTYKDTILEAKDKKYVILENAEIISNEKYQSLRKLFPNATFILFCSIIKAKDNEDYWLKMKKVAYSYTLQESLNDGYINPRIITEKNLENLIYKLLIPTNYTIEIEPKIELGNKAFRPDFIIGNDKGKKLIEVKKYRSRIVSNTILNGAVEQVKFYKKAWENIHKEPIKAILIVSCQVQDELKKSYYKESNIIIIDVSNLLYLMQDNEKLLSQLIENVEYNISSIPPTEVLDVSSLKTNENPKTEEVPENLEIVGLIKRLENLPPGKKDNNDKKYEKLCTDIINYLFKNDFTKMKEQHSTEDQMFRMDLICGIKSTSEFWNVLAQYYNTKFIVFEFKNYEEEIDQNLIYITEKYLYKATLRNVAIIISRKGFSPNAHKAANGVLTENGKLIIDLSDQDIITMLRMKADKEDASDYLLDKLENWLMSISK